MDPADAPTLLNLNKPQKRALILRDRLRITHQSHLDGFIQGIAYNEPPAYKRINGTVHPPLAMVTLKESANRFDLGNVLFQNDVVLPNGIYSAHLTVEHGRIEIRTEDALPPDERNIDTVPIHVFIAKNMVPMFEDKVKAIVARMKQVNDVRLAAFSSVQKPVEQYQKGETLARLETEQSAHDGSSSQARISKKRQPGEPVNKHASNKRKRIGLDTIPHDAKTATFDTIPEKIKIDLFDNVVKTALPNFDNLMVASWNVVSVYSNVGTDFPELHKSIVELKSVLQDFEDGIGPKVSHKELKVRKDLVPPTPQDENHTGSTKDFSGASRIARLLSTEAPPEAPHNSVKTPATTTQNDVNINLDQQNKDEDRRIEEPHEVAVTEEQQIDMAPPLDLQQMIKRHDDAGDGDDEGIGHKAKGQTESRTSSTVNRQSSMHLPTPEQDIRRPTESPLFERESSRSPSEAQDVLSSYSTVSPELLRRREEYASSITAKPKPKTKMRDTQGSPASTSQSPSTTTSKRGPRLSAAARHEPSTSPDSTDSAQSSRSSSPKEKKTQKPKRKTLADMSTAELRAAYKARKAELIETFGANTNVPQQYRAQMQKMMAEIKARERADAEARETEETANGEDDSNRAKAGGTMFLGNSLLGGKKVGGGAAPVAPMQHMRKDSGGGGSRSGQ